MRWKHREMMAAWAVAVGLVLLIASAPWDRLSSRVPPGVVDVGNQRFAVGEFEASPSGPVRIPHQEDSRFSLFAPEEL
jgi:hypothetical protein